MPVRSFLPLSLAATLLLTGAASAQSVTLIGAFKDWSAYSASDGAGAVCFAMSKPTDVSPFPTATRRPISI